METNCVGMAAHAAAFASDFISLSKTPIAVPHASPADLALRIL
jgi:hypothetical protein